MVKLQEVFVIPRTEMVKLQEVFVIPRTEMVKLQEQDDDIAQVLPTSGPEANTRCGHQSAGITNSVLIARHDAAGHQGSECTLTLVKMRCYWPTMTYRNGVTSMSDVLWLKTYNGYYFRFVGLLVQYIVIIADLFHTCILLSSRFNRV